MADVKISALSNASTPLAGTEVVPVVQGGVTYKTAVSNIAALASSGVTSVGMTVPTGLSVTGSPITSTGTLAVSYSAGYSIPTTSKQSEWDTAYGWGNHASAGYLTSATAATTYQPLDDDLTAIAGLSGTSGLLKKTAANTWTLDTTAYLSGTVAIANGGTGGTTASTARSNLLPSYTANATKVLAVNSGATDVEWITVSGGGSGTTTNAATFNNSGSGDASGTTFDGSVARTISYNTIGAPSTTGTNATGTWSIDVLGSAGSATNLLGGAANRIAYQSGSNTTTFITAPTSSDTYLKWSGSAFTWATVSGGTGGGSPNLDGGTPSSSYLAVDPIDGGTP